MDDDVLVLKFVDCVVAEDNVVVFVNEVVSFELVVVTDDRPDEGPEVELVDVVELTV